MASTTPPPPTTSKRKKITMAGDVVMIDYTISVKKVTWSSLQ